MRRIVIAHSVCQRCGETIDLVGCWQPGAVQACDADLGEKPTFYLWTLPMGSTWCEEDRAMGPHVSSGPQDLTDPVKVEAWLTS